MSLSNPTLLSYDEPLKLKRNIVLDVNKHYLSANHIPQLKQVVFYYDSHKGTLYAIGKLPYDVDGVIPTNYECDMVELNEEEREIVTRLRADYKYTVKTQFVSFSFPELNYVCSLNPIGRKRYGNLEQLLESGTGVSSTVGMPDGSRYELPDIRKSFKYQSIVEFDLDPILVNEHLEKLIEDGFPSWENKQKYDIIEYLPGGFFKEHCDKQVKKTHYGTLLIFPPALGKLEHTGGEFIIDKGRFRFDSSKNTEWTFIAFHTNLPHECMEILSGTRVVFKTELYCYKHFLIRERRTDYLVD
jgi:hypothetical protein